MKRIPKTLRPLVLAGFVATITLGSGACATQHTSEPTEISPATEQKIENVEFNLTLKAAQNAWKLRLQREQLEIAIQHWQNALLLGLDEPDTELAEIHEHLARAYYLLADSHIRLTGDDEQANHPDMMAAYEKGIAAAESALTLRDPEFVAKITAGQPWAEAVQTAQNTAIPALYWYSANLGNWALIEGIATQLARKDDIKATMDFIADTQPDFFYAAAYRYLGVYWVSLPFGNDPEKSQAAFDQSLQIAPNVFATHVLIAQTLANATENTELFNNELNFVLETPPNIIPELEPENTLEQQKARRLLAPALP